MAGLRAAVETYMLPKFGLYGEKCWMEHGILHVPAEGEIKWCEVGGTKWASDTAASANLVFLWKL
jgi:hypothetical protein